MIKLIYPKDTHMDFNIGSCLNMITGGPTDAKIFLSGLGADEIFGGYSRYWVAFRRGGYQAL